MSALQHRIQAMIGRAVIAAVKSSTKMQEVQVELLADETHDGVEHFEPYGLTAHPKVGAEAIMLAVGGLRSHGLIINVADRRYRLTGLAEGEVAIHDDQAQKVHLTRDGIVIKSDKGVTIDAAGADVAITCDNFTVTAADTISLASDDVKIGNGATLAAARKTDPVASSAISNGSTKVKIA